MLDNFRELYKYRLLLSALVKRHLAMRYRGSVLGFLWSFLNPLMLMLVYTVVFRYYIRFNEVENYTIFLFCGLLPWLWMTAALSEGTSSIVSSGHLITKSMFPAHLLPTVAVITSMIHYLLSLPLLFIFMLLAGMPFHITLLMLPVIIVVQFLFSYGLVLALSALNVHFRDVQHLLANFLTFLFFLIPVLYPVSTVPERFRFTMYLNPFALLTVWYHDIVLVGTLPSLSSLAFLFCFAITSVVIGNMIFNRYRESLAEAL